MLRLALIGCGRHSELQHAAPLARYAAAHPGAIELVAACDLSAERTADICRRFGFARAYTDLTALLDSETLDGCITVMPVTHIVPVATLLLQRGIPCVIEKPPATSPTEARQLMNLALQSGTPHMVSMNRRFDPYLNQARTWAKENGPLRFIRAAMVRHKRREDDFIWTTGLHAVDAMRYIGGQVETFEVTKHDAAAASWYEITFAFQSGARGRLDVMPTAGTVEESYELLGDDYSTRVDIGIRSPAHLQCRLKNRMVTDMNSPPTESPDVTNGSYHETCAWIEALQNCGLPHPSLSEVMPSLDICFRAFETE